MGDGPKQMVHGDLPPEAEDDELSESPSLSCDSNSSSSFDFTDDATSSNGPLYRLPSIMQQFPIKKGLSKYFQGKSQSFTSLANVRCVDDLAKKERPYKRKMNTSTSYAGGLDTSQTLYCTTEPCKKSKAKKALQDSRSKEQ